MPLHGLCIDMVYDYTRDMVYDYTCVMHCVIYALYITLGKTTPKDIPRKSHGNPVETT
jgi:hypothetical protein